MSRTQKQAIQQWSRQRRSRPSCPLKLGNGYKPKMELTQAHRDALTDILRWRRDVRHFRPDPVDPAVLARLQTAMEMAPSVGNARPWRVLNVVSEDKRSAVIANFERANAAAATRYQGTKRDKYNALKLASCVERPPPAVPSTAPDSSDNSPSKSNPD